MRFAKLIAVGLCLTSVCTCTFAQTANPAVEAVAKPAVKAAEAAIDQITPAVEPAVQHVPAGALGFVLVNNIQSISSRVDAYLVAIGADEMTSQAMPDGLLEMIRQQLMLADGFNPAGGFAVVMLDPQQYDFSILAAMGLEQNATTAPAEPPKVPFVLLIPAASVESLFANYQMEPAGELTKVQLRMGESYAVQVGGYVAVGPAPKAVQAIADTSCAKIAGELTPKHLAALGRADIAVHLNMKVAGPILNRFIKKGEEQMAQMQEMMADHPSQEPVPPQLQMAMLAADIMPMYRQMIDQLQAVTVSGRFVETGVVIDGLVSFLPDSEMGQLLAAFEAPGASLVNRLPDLPYVLAMGATGGAAAPKLQNTMETRMMDALINSDIFAEIPDEVKTQAKDLLKSWSGEVESVQLVAGGAPEGAGLFGVAYLIVCKDAAKLKDMLAESAAVSETIVKSIDEEDVQELGIAYSRDVEALGDLSIDVIEITHPELAEQDEDDQAEMAQVLGEKKIRILVASPDENTVVLTFGGSTAFLAEAVKAAAGGGIAKKPEVIAAMKHMPANPMMVVLFNGKNLYDLIVNGMAVMSPGSEEGIPFAFAAEQPITIGVGIDGPAEHIAVYIPTEFVKEVVNIFKQMMPSMGQPPQPESMPADEDF